jgi:hypothetical protein
MMELGFEVGLNTGILDARKVGRSVVLFGDPSATQALGCSQNLCQTGSCLQESQILCDIRTSTMG